MVVVAHRTTDLPAARTASTAADNITCGPLVFRGIVFALLFEAGAAVGLWTLYRVVMSFI